MSTHPNPEGGFHTPGDRFPKLIYLIFGGVVFALGLWLTGEIVLRLAFGETANARVSEIRVKAPAEPERSYKYRRPWVDNGDYRVVFSHYVDLQIDGQTEAYRISVDSRRIPIESLNVNDRIDVSYFPGDPHKVAYAHKMVRTWGIAVMVLVLGGTMLTTGIPMFLAVGKPIKIDPEADDPIEENDPNVNQKKAAADSHDSD